MLKRWWMLCLPMALLACGASQERPLPRPARATVATTAGVPEQAIAILRHVRAHGSAPAGIEGGRHFGNFEHRLPEHGADGRAMRYQEWDVWPKVRGRNRGTERLITGSDGRAWYTGDHYRSFVEVHE
jgi:guanyl-specific ribonuclease Sa